MDNICETSDTMEQCEQQHIEKRLKYWYFTKMPKRIPLEISVSKLFFMLLFFIQLFLHFIQKKKLKLILIEI